jgi:O-methyltransferase/methyltransferase family protein
MTIACDLAERLYSIGSAYRQAKVLLSAVELDVFSVLAKEPLNAATLAARLDIDRRGARDFFDALVALDLLNRDADGRYQNTEATNLYLDRAKPTYLGGSFDQYNRREYGMWGLLTEALRTGSPRTEIEGYDHFGSIYHDPIRFRSFVNAMTAGSMLSARRIAEQFPWKKWRTLCDVGTAQGCLPVQIALAHPHIEAIGFDLPALRSVFDQYVRDNGLSQRLTFRAGDFFEDPLPPADVIVFGRVLHNWDLATKKMLLAKAYAALPKSGAVINYDMLIDDERSSSTSGLLSSLNMLLWTSAGFGYSGADCVDWMREAGFHDMRIERLAGGNSMVIGMR